MSMDVFITWSGDTSRRIAAVLREWLPNIMQAVKPFMSEEDIRKGRRWFEEIGAKLSKTEFGILCLTHDNTRSPWIHFEAGALSKLPTSSLCAVQSAVIGR